MANAFLVLILLIFLLAANKGGRDFFSSLLSQIRNTETTLGSGQNGPSIFDQFLEAGRDEAEQQAGDWLTRQFQNYAAGRNRDQQNRGTTQ